MRLSVVEGHSGYRDWCVLLSRGGRAIVRLDGVEQRDVVEADEEQGWLIKNSRGESGDILIDQQRRETIKTVCHGKVEIELVWQFETEE